MIEYLINGIVINPQVNRTIHNDYNTFYLSVNSLSIRSIMSVSEIFDTLFFQFYSIFHRYLFMQFHFSIIGWMKWKNKLSKTEFLWSNLRTEKNIYDILATFACSTFHFIFSLHHLTLWNQCSEPKSSF